MRAPVAGTAAATARKACARSNARSPQSKARGQTSRTRARCRSGIAGVDAALGGGLALGALHEIAPAGPVHRGAAFGFALALAGQACERSHAERCCGSRRRSRPPRPAGPMASASRAFGLALAARAGRARAAQPVDVLWVMEEALGCRGIAAVIAEVTEELALTATRRLSLAVRHGGGFGLLVRHRVSPQPNAALTRWQVAAARSPPDAYGGLGATAFDLDAHQEPPWPVRPLDHPVGPS